jgi:hypothetical protein
MYNYLKELLGGKESCKINYNTYVEARKDGLIAVRLHDTDIITVTPNNSAELNAGGFLTKLTHDRLNFFLNPYARVIARKGLWYVQVKGEIIKWRSEIPFRDGMNIDF